MLPFVTNGLCLCDGDVGQLLRSLMLGFMSDLVCACDSHMYLCVVWEKVDEGWVGAVKSQCLLVTLFCILTVCIRAAHLGGAHTHTHNMIAQQICRESVIILISHSHTVNKPLSTTVAMETLSAAGHSHGRTSLLCTVLCSAIVVPAEYWGRQTAVIHCCRSHKGSCHTIQQIHKPQGLMSHSNICLAVKTLTPRRAM